ncbi:hypothetical protein BJ322DRAFT_1039127 [Thelephora terrestris]|uniref:Uncharacterized protein n=1 Tax=Thelephora terrestris TaxID=56493 RepID=A0A9P6HR39_9AGAM|nr:hypothetical protein BJ322DRAFT_1039127 [Thelephora terrestris]
MELPQPAALPATHLNLLLPTDLMFLAIPPIYEIITTKTTFSVGFNTAQISCDNVSPPHRHAHTRKSSSPILAHPGAPDLCGDNISSLHCRAHTRKTSSPTPVHLGASHLHRHSTPISTPSREVERLLRVCSFTRGKPGHPFGSQFHSLPVPS